MVVATVKGQRLPTPEALDNLPTFLEAAPALLAALPKGGVLVLEAPSSDTESQASLTEQIEQRIVLGDQQWVAQGQVGDGSVQANAARALSGSGQQDGWIGTGQGCM